MRLPWVSRESFDLALRAEQRRADAEHENAQVLRRENADLLTKYHALKQQGYAEPAPITPRDIPKPDPVKRAIAQKAGANRILRDQMEAQAQLDRISGKSEDEIVFAIMTGMDGTQLTEAG